MKADQLIQFLTGLTGMVLGLYLVYLLRTCIKYIMLAGILLFLISMGFFYKMMDVRDATMAEHLLKYAYTLLICTSMGPLQIGSQLWWQSKKRKKKRKKN